MANSKVEFKEGIPVDAKTGSPLVLISFSAEELVPTGKFANIKVGPAVASKYVPNDLSNEDRAKEIAELAKPVEWALGHRRDEIMKEIAGKSGDAE